MECDNEKYKIQALVDKELPENEINEVVSHIENCYKCREEYVEMLKLDKKLKGASFPEPEFDWYSAQRKKFLRGFLSFFSKLMMLFSFLTIFTWGIVQLLKDRNIQPILQIAVIGLVLGFGILIFVSLSDRKAEKKHDKYRSLKK